MVGARTKREKVRARWKGFLQFLSTQSSHILKQLVLHGWRLVRVGLDQASSLFRVVVIGCGAS